MKKTLGIVLALGSAAAATLYWRKLIALSTQPSRRSKGRSARLEILPHDTALTSLVDLNTADAESLKQLHLDPQPLDRLIENRPYRTKLELVSRMVLTEAEYESVRDRVTVAESQEPSKIA